MIGLKRTSRMQECKGKKELLARGGLLKVLFLPKMVGKNVTYHLIDFFVDYFNLGNTFLSIYCYFNYI